MLTWWNSSYARRIPITLDNLDQATTHTNLPVLVRLTPARINYDHFQPDGADLRFTLSNHSTVLSHDIEHWNPGGESLVWVRVPSIAASANTLIYAYYENPAAIDGQDPAGTWNGFSGVWNMNKSGANYVDATQSGKDASPVGTVTDIAGPLGSAVSLNGSSALNTGFNLATIIGQTSTFSFWIRTSQAGSNTVWQAPGVTGVEQSGGANDIFFGFINGSGRIAVAAGNGSNASSGFTVNDGNWRHVTMSRNSSNGAVRFYINGVFNNSATSESGNKSTPFTNFGMIANTGGASNFLNGALDGIRLIGSISSDDRIRAEYKYSVETHVSYGPVEQY
jgi:MSHA biogenesis protein MshQ